MGHANDLQEWLCFIIVALLPTNNLQVFNHLNLAALN
jgi:hypothetical protein